MKYCPFCESITLFGVPLFRVRRSRIDRKLCLDCAAAIELDRVCRLLNGVLQSISDAGGFSGRGPLGSGSPGARPGQSGSCSLATSSTATTPRQTVQEPMSVATLPKSGAIGRNIGESGDRSGSTLITWESIWGTSSNTPHMPHTRTSRLKLRLARLKESRDE